MALRLERASSQQLSVGSGIASGVPFTVGCTVKFAQTTDTQYVWSIGSDGSGAKWYALILNATGPVIQITYHDGSTTDTFNILGFGVTAGVLYRCIFVAEALDQRRGNVNNGGIEPNDITLMNAITNQRFTVGCYRDDLFGSSDFTDAEISEVAFWNVALDFAERTAYQKGISASLIRPQSLAGYWPLVNDTFPAIDLGRGNNPLTQSNTPTNAAHPSVWGAESGHMGTQTFFDSTYVLAMDVGTYALTGIAAALKAGYKIAAVTGVYTLTGTAASLLYGLFIAAETGIYTITGATMSFTSRFVEQVRLFASYARSKFLKGSI